LDFNFREEFWFLLFVKAFSLPTALWPSHAPFNGHFGLSQMLLQIAVLASFNHEFDETVRYFMG